MIFLRYVLCFFIYAFLGYLCEVVYCSICQKKLVNRGYLYMPICPIYGYGAVLILLVMEPLFQYWYLVLILGILLTSTLEYLTSYLMEIIFHMRWWDYSKRKFNINGRVCLRNSILFGALVMLVVYGIQPFLLKWIDRMPQAAIIIVDSLLLTAMVVDTIFSTIKNINISKLIVKLQDFKDAASDKLVQIKEGATDKLLELKEEASNRIAETKENFTNSPLIVKFKELLDKYPNMALRSFGKERKSVEDLLKDYAADEAGVYHDESH